MPTLTVTARDAAGNETVQSLSYTIASSTSKKIIGMSAPAPEWGTRLLEVGPIGITARRIFAQLDSSATDQQDLVSAAHNAGMMPVISYKVPNVATAASGGYDSWFTKAATLLDSFGKPTAAVFHHEPYGDITPAQFISVQERFTGIFRRGQIKVGPILNGWLLDRKVADFTSFTSPALLNSWDFMGIDTYESGTFDTPGPIKPADRVPKLVSWLSSQGHASMPIGIGEYNGYSADTITAAGEAFLSCPTLWFACMWNSVAGKGYVLTGERLDAFKATKADSRVRH